MSARDEAAGGVADRMERYAQRFERAGKNGHAEVIRRWASEVRKLASPKAEPEDCRGVLGGKIAISHLVVSRDGDDYCARCGMSPAAIAEARGKTLSDPAPSPRDQACSAMLGSAAGAAPFLLAAEDPSASSNTVLAEFQDASAALRHLASDLRRQGYAFEETGNAVVAERLAQWAEDAELLSKKVSDATMRMVNERLAEAQRGTTNMLGLAVALLERDIAKATREPDTRGEASTPDY